MDFERNPFDKKCPECGGRIAFGRYVRARSRTFACDACRAELQAVSLGRMLFVNATGSLFISIPLVQGLRDHRWWWALIPGLTLYSVYCLALYRPQSLRRSAQARSA